MGDSDDEEVAVVVDESMLPSPTAVSPSYLTESKSSYLDDVKYNGPDPMTESAILKKSYTDVEKMENRERRRKKKKTRNDLTKSSSNVEKIQFTSELTKSSSKVEKMEFGESRTSKDLAKSSSHVEKASRRRIKAKSATSVRSSSRNTRSATNLEGGKSTTILGKAQTVGTLLPSAAPKSSY